MSPHALDKTGTRHTDTQWKVKGGEGREQKLLNAPHIQLLLPAPLMNKPYSLEHEEFHACASILIPLTNWLQTLLVVYLVKLCLTSFKCNLTEWINKEHLCSLEGLRNCYAYIPVHSPRCHCAVLPLAPVHSSGVCVLLSFAVFIHAPAPVHALS